MCQGLELTIYTLHLNLFLIASEIPPTPSNFARITAAAVIAAVIAAVVFIAMAIMIIIMIKNIHNKKKREFCTWHAKHLCNYFYYYNNAENKIAHEKGDV